ncbi:MAG TPA: DUF2231 domain-containing protein [bacterium]|nr:DUF2231 domain-containing protein [bacterium]
MLDFHPFVVHFAIGLLTASVVFDVLSVTANRPHLQLVGWWNLFLGFLAVLFAVITGLYAKNNAFFPEASLQLISYHQYFGISTAVIFTLLFVWRSGMNRKIMPRWQSLYLLIAVLGTVLILVTGLLGGQMVFEHGTNVQRVRELQEIIDSLRILRNPPPP